MSVASVTSVATVSSAASVASVATVLSATAVSMIIISLFQVMIFIGMTAVRSEEHTSELQSRPHISYAVFCLKKKDII